MLPSSHPSKLLAETSEVANASRIPSAFSRRDSFFSHNISEPQPRRRLIGGEGGASKPQKMTGDGLSEI